MSEIGTQSIESSQGSSLSLNEVSEVHDEAGEQNVESTDALHGADDPRTFRLERSDEYLEPMSRARGVEQFRDPREFVDRINPGFETEEAYQVNCADCARCCEATWRGRQQEAAGRAYQLSDRGGLEAHGENSDVTAEWAHETFKSTDAASLRFALEQGGHGSSAIVHSIWEGVDQEGHAYNAMNVNAEILVVDSQRGEVYNFASSIYPGMERLPGLSHRTMAWDADGRRVL